MAAMFDNDLAHPPGSSHVQSRQQLNGLTSSLSAFGISSPEGLSPPPSHSYYHSPPPPPPHYPPPHPHSHPHSHPHAHPPGQCQVHPPKPVEPQCTCGHAHVHDEEYLYSHSYRPHGYGYGYAPGPGYGYGYGYPHGHPHGPAYGHPYSHGYGHHYGHGHNEYGAAYAKRPLPQVPVHVNHPPPSRQNSLGAPEAALERQGSVDAPLLHELHKSIMDIPTHRPSPQAPYAQPITMTGGVVMDDGMVSTESGFVASVTPSRSPRRIVRTSTAPPLSRQMTSPRGDTLSSKEEELLAQLAVPQDIDILQRERSTASSSRSRVSVSIQHSPTLGVQDSPTIGYRHSPIMASGTDFGSTTGSLPSSVSSRTHESFLGPITPMSPNAELTFLGVPTPTSPVSTKSPGRQREPKEAETQTLESVSTRHSPMPQPQQSLSRAGPSYESPLPRSQSQPQPQPQSSPSPARAPQPQLSPSRPKPHRSNGYSGLVFTSSPPSTSSARVPSSPSSAYSTSTMRHGSLRRAASVSVSDTSSVRSPSIGTSSRNKKTFWQNVKSSSTPVGPYGHLPQDKVQRLIALGFEPAAVRLNLTGADGDFQVALDMLVHDAHLPPTFSFKKKKNVDPELVSFKPDCAVCYRRKYGGAEKHETVEGWLQQQAEKAEREKRRLAEEEERSTQDEWGTLKDNTKKDEENARTSPQASVSKKGGSSKLANMFSSKGKADKANFDARVLEASSELAELSRLPSWQHGMRSYGMSPKVKGYLGATEDSNPAAGDTAAPGTDTDPSNGTTNGNDIGNGADANGTGITGAGKTLRVRPSAEMLNSGISKRHGLILGEATSPDLTLSLPVSAPKTPVTTPATPKTPVTSSRMPAPLFGIGPAPSSAPSIKSVSSKSSKKQDKKDKKEKKEKAAKAKPKPPPMEVQNMSRYLAMM